MTEDSELLRRYSEEKSEEAFTELVQRHLPLVYGAALRRMGGDPHLAMDVAQTVFIALARRADAFSARTPLPAWLYRVTRNTAVDLWRREMRRRNRDLEIMKTQELSTSENALPDWERLGSLVDAEMDGLPERDRTAVVLRYFAGRSYPDIASTLKLTEESARKRVDRALERLREQLARRGVTSTAAVLAGLLTANGAQAAPANLTATISRGAVAAGAATGVSGLSAFLVFMSTSKIIATGAVVLLLGAAYLLERERQMEELSRQLTTSQAMAALRTQPRMVAPAVTAAPIAPVADPLGIAGDMGKWLGQLQKVQDLLGAHSDQWIPELGLLNDRDWLIAAMGAQLESEVDQRIFFGRLRNTAKVKFMRTAQQAMLRYAEAHDGNLPAQATDLMQFLPPRYAKADIMERYGMFKTGRVADIPRIGGWDANVMGELAPQRDAEYDTQIGWSVTGATAHTYSKTEVAYNEAVAAFAKSNNGQKAMHLPQLAPYLPSEGLDQERLEQLFTTGMYPNWMNP